MAVEATEFRRVAGCFATGVTIVTCQIGAITHGITVNSFTSVSLDPPLVLICVDQKARAHDLIREAGTFAVNVLAEHQRELCTYFARRLAPDPDDELRDVPHHPGANGAPLLDGAVAYVECRLTETFRAGDHSIYLGEVVSAEVSSEHPPLVFHRGTFPRITPLAP